MNILTNAQQIIQLYIDSLAVLRVKKLPDNNTSFVEAECFLCNIRDNLNKVADATSLNAAKLEKQLCSSLCGWATNVFNMNYKSPSAALSLREAVNISALWADLPPHTAKFGLFKGGVREATAADYFTLDDFKQSGIGKQVELLIQTVSAKSKIEAITNLIAMARERLPVDAIERQKQRIEQMTAEQSLLQKELENAALRYQESRDRQEIKYSNMIAKEMMLRRKGIEKCKAKIKALSNDLAFLSMQCTSRENLIRQVEQLLHLVLTHIDNDPLIVSFADMMPPHLIHRMLLGNATKEDLDQFVSTSQCVEALIHASLFSFEFDEFDLLSRSDFVL